MIPSYSLNHLHIFHLFLIILAAWCFSEPCIYDSTCVISGFQCRFGHCLCPPNQFWAGYDKHCIRCPDGWINLLAFCIYYGHEMMKWLDAEKVCQQMANSVNEPTRLLELNNQNEFDFIRKMIQQILTDNQMKPEINTRNRILSSATAFIGSQGKRISKEEWFYYWGNDVNKRYTSTSQMWCKEIHWGSITFQAEPAWENDNRMEETFQALKRWNDGNDACLVSLVSDSRQPFLCEIVGESGRFGNQPILPFLVTTIPSTLSTTTRRQTVLTDRLTSTTRKPIVLTDNLSSTTKKQTVIVDLSSLIITQPLLTTSIFSNTTSVKLNLTSDQPDVKQNGSLFIIIGILGIIILILIFMFIIHIQCKKKQPSIKLKLDNNGSLSRFKTKKKYTEDIHSNGSSESHLSAETSTLKSEESHRIYTDNQSLTPSKSASVKPARLALWDQMESSLFSSTLHEPIKRQPSYSSK